MEGIGIVHMAFVRWESGAPGMGGLWLRAYLTVSQPPWVSLRRAEVVSVRKEWCSKRVECSRNVDVRVASVEC